MKPIKYQLFVLLSVSFLSCTKVLELEPVSQISNSSFWKNESDALGGLTGMYASLRSQSTNNLFIWGEARSDAMGNNVAAPVFQNWYMNTLTASNSQSIFTGASTTWSGMYSLIHAANLLINNVPQIEFSSDAKKNNLLAQGYSMRAYAYFVLVRTFGGVPLMTEPINGDLDNAQKEKATVQQVFDLIKSDIDKALTLYPDNSLPSGRALWSGPSTQALKADVYLWTAKKLNGGANDYSKVLTAITEIEKADVILLNNFDDIFKYDNKGNKEILFAVRRKFEETTEATMYAWGYILDTFIPTDLDASTRAEIAPSAGAPYWSPSEKARNAFATDDSRKKPTLIELYTKDANGNPKFYTSVINKFNGTVISGARYFVDDYVVYRYADVVLMKAEAKNALGQDPSTEINLIRKRAYGVNFSNHVFQNGTQAQNEQAILDERFKELMFEGKRWWDLIRFDKAFNEVPSLVGRQSQNYLLLFPIPISTLSLNAKLTQNPGYN